MPKGRGSNRRRQSDRQRRPRDKSLYVERGANKLTMLYERAHKAFMKGTR